MMVHRSGMWTARRSWLAIVACGLTLSVGCGVLNPSLLAAFGSNTASQDTAPNGFIVILLTNRAAVSVQARVQVTKTNGSAQEFTLSSAPLNFFAFTQECDVAAVQFTSFGYASSAGTINVNANLGQLQVGNGLECGNVISVVADGNPPAFSVEVY